jgi:hypothetical protein
MAAAVVLEENQGANNAEWTDENTRIVCELFAEQVRIGNRSNTHLNKVGYDNVIAKFEEKTGLRYQKLQFKNKWSKLRNEYNLWKKLIARETGLGWDQARATIVASDDWWARAKKVCYILMLMFKLLTMILQIFVSLF